MTDEQRTRAEQEMVRGFERHPVPVHMQDGVIEYVIQRRDPGHFLTAVLENNLVGAIGRADSSNLKALQNWVRVCYNYIPSTCWGNPAKVKAWLNRTEEV